MKNGVHLLPFVSPSVCVSAGEVLKSKSPAEFFADNQNIAGFDNVSRVFGWWAPYMIVNAKFYNGDLLVLGLQSRVDFVRTEIRCTSYLFRGRVKYQIPPQQPLLL